MDAVAIGELLVDFTPLPGAATAFAPHPGGAPANVMVQLARLGHATGFMGAVGPDAFGRFLREALVAEGVDTTGLIAADIPTTLAFVHLAAGGERSFTFYRSADAAFAPSNLDEAAIGRARVLHFGGVSLSASPMRAATLAAARSARRQGLLVSYDPNYRPMLWLSQAQAVRHMADAVPLCDVLKVSDDEAQLLTGRAEPEAAAAQLLAAGPQLVLLTLGAAGCLCASAAGVARFAAPRVPTVDTTGCGDSFLGAALSQLLALGTPPGQCTAAQLAAVCRYATAAGAVCATAHGAIPALPDDAAIRRLM